MVAINYGELSTVHLLLEREANPNLMVTREQSMGFLVSQSVAMPLFQYTVAELWPAFSNADRAAALSDMLAHGAQADRHDADGNSALVLACENNIWDVVPLLLVHHVDVNARNERGETALFSAVADIPTLQLLLKYGARVDLRDRKGQTALMEVINYSSPEMVQTDMAAIRLLISHGANVNAKDRDGETALSRLMDDDEPTPEIRQVMALLKEAGATELPANRRRIQHPLDVRM